MRWPAARVSPLLDFDYLIVKNMVEEDDKLEDYLIPKTEFKTHSVMDYNAATSRIAVLFHVANANTSQPVIDDILFMENVKVARHRHSWIFGRTLKWIRRRKSWWRQ